MSRDIDEQIIRMEFDNKDFEKKVAETQRSLNELKSSLDMDGEVESFNDLDKASKNVKFSEMQEAVTEVHNKFSAMEVVVKRVFENITDYAMQTAQKIINKFSELSAYSAQNVNAGFQKYESVTTGIQVLVGSGKATMEEAQAVLDKLTWFSDETSADLSSMVGNLSKFVNAGVSLDDAMVAIEGIAMLGSSAGQNARVASEAMYQLSQALGVGYMRYEDWKSLTNRNMDTVAFKQAVLDAAVNAGKLTEINGKYYMNAAEQAAEAGSFVGYAWKNGVYQYIGESTQEAVNGTEITLDNLATTLTEGKWLTNDVLMEALASYGVAANQLYDAYQNMDDINGEYGTDLQTTSDIIKAIKDGTIEASEAIDEVSLKYFELAQEAKTWTEVWEATKVAISTSWYTIFQNLFGNYEEQKAFWTDIVNQFWDLFVGPLERLKEISFAFGKAGTNSEFSLFDEEGNEVDATIRVFDELVQTGDDLSQTLDEDGEELYKVFEILDKDGNVIDHFLSKAGQFEEGMDVSEYFNGVEARVGGEVDAAGLFVGEKLKLDKDSIFNEDNMSYFRKSLSNLVRFAVNVKTIFGEILSILFPAAKDSKYMDLSERIYNFTETLANSVEWINEEGSPELIKLEDIFGGIGVVLGFVKDALSGIWNFGKSILTGAFGILTKIFSILFPIKEEVQEDIPETTKNLKNVKNVVVEFTEATTTAGNAIHKLPFDKFELIKKTFDNIADVGKALGRVLKNVFKILGAVGEALGVTIFGTIKDLLGLGASGEDTIAGKLNKLADKLEVSEDSLKKLKDIVKDLVDIIRKPFSKAINFVQDKINLFHKNENDSTSGEKKGFLSTIEDYINKIKTFLDLPFSEKLGTIKKWFTDTYESVKSFFEIFTSDKNASGEDDATTGASNGLNLIDKAKEAIDKFKESLDKAWESIKTWGEGIDWTKVEFVVAILAIAGMLITVGVIMYNAYTTVVDLTTILNDIAYSVERVTNAGRRVLNTLAAVNIGVLILLIVITIKKVVEVMKDFKNLPSWGDMLNGLAKVIVFMLAIGLYLWGLGAITKYMKGIGTTILSMILLAGSLYTLAWILKGLEGITIDTDKLKDKWVLGVIPVVFSLMSTLNGFANKDKPKTSIAETIRSIALLVIAIGASVALLAGSLIVMMAAYAISPETFKMAISYLLSVVIVITSLVAALMLISKFCTNRSSSIKDITTDLGTKNQKNLTKSKETSVAASSFSGLASIILSISAGMFLIAWAIKDLASVSTNIGPAVNAITGILTLLGIISIFILFLSNKNQQSSSTAFGFKIPEGAKIARPEYSKSSSSSGLKGMAVIILSIAASVWIISKTIMMLANAMSNNNGGINDDVVGRIWIGFGLIAATLAIIGGFLVIIAKWGTHNKDAKADLLATAIAVAGIMFAFRLLLATMQNITDFTAIDHAMEIMVALFAMLALFGAGSRGANVGAMMTSIVALAAVVGAIWGLYELLKKMMEDGNFTNFVVFMNVLKPFLMSLLVSLTIITVIAKIFNSIKEWKKYATGYGDHAPLEKKSKTGADNGYIAIVLGGIAVMIAEVGLIVYEIVELVRKYPLATKWHNLWPMLAAFGIVIAGVIAIAITMSHLKVNSAPGYAKNMLALSGGIAIILAGVAAVLLAVGFAAKLMKGVEWYQSVILFGGVAAILFILMHYIDSFQTVLNNSKKNDTYSNKIVKFAEAVTAILLSISILFITIAVSATLIKNYGALGPTIVLLIGAIAIIGILSLAMSNIKAADENKMRTAALGFMGIALAVSAMIIAIAVSAAFVSEHSTWGMALGAVITAIGLLAAIVGAMWLMSKIKGNIGTYAKTILAVGGIVAALVIVCGLAAVAIKKTNSLNEFLVVAGMAIIALIGIAAAIAILNAAGVTGATMMSLGGGIAVVAVALGIMAGILVHLANVLKNSKCSEELKTLAIIMGIFLGAVVLLGAGLNEFSLYVLIFAAAIAIAAVGVGLGFLLMSASIYILAVAIEKLIAIAEYVKENWGSFEEWMREVVANAVGILVGFAEQLAIEAPKIAAAVGQIFAAIFTVLIQVSLQNLATFLETLGKFIEEYWPTIQATIAKWFPVVWKFLGELIQTCLINPIKIVGGDTWIDIKAWFLRILMFIGDVFVSIGAGLGDFFFDIIKALKSSLVTVVDIAKTLIWTNGVLIMIDKLKLAATTIGDLILSVIDPDLKAGDVIDNFKTESKKIEDQVSENWKNLGNDIQDEWSNFKPFELSDMWRVTADNTGYGAIDRYVEEEKKKLKDLYDTGDPNTGTQNTTTGNQNNKPKSNPGSKPNLPVSLNGDGETTLGAPIVSGSKNENAPIQDTTTGKNLEKDQSWLDKTMSSIQNTINKYIDGGKTKEEIIAGLFGSDGDGDGKLDFSWLTSAFNNISFDNLLPKMPDFLGGLFGGDAMTEGGEEDGQSWIEGFKSALSSGEFGDMLNNIDIGGTKLGEMFNTLTSGDLTALTGKEMNPVSVEQNLSMSETDAEGNVTVYNTFTITGDNPRQIAEEVMVIMAEQTEGGSRAHGNIVI